MGEAVKLLDGPFADFLGTIDNIDETRGKLRVLVSIFGRETPVELDFYKLRKPLRIDLHRSKRINTDI